MKPEEFKDLVPNLLAEPAQSVCTRPRVWGASWSRVGGAGSDRTQPTLQDLVYQDPSLLGSRGPAPPSSGRDSQA